MPEQKNRFAILNCIDCSDHVEQKNGLAYLSWAWAWTEFKKKFPDSYYTVYEAPNGCNYFSDGKTCWVKTGVTLVDGDFHLEHIEYLPIMDFRNKSLALDNVTSTDVNKTIQRSLTKAIARHGLGCYIYAGEDLPEPSEEDKAEVEKLLIAIMARFTEVTKAMTREEKINYCNTVVKPIVGVTNFKNCDDKNKLTKLLKAMQ